MSPSSTCGRRLRPKRYGVDSERFATLWG